VLAVFPKVYHKKRVGIGGFIGRTYFGNAFGDGHLIIRKYFPEAYLTRAYFRNGWSLFGFISQFNLD
jgi:hypothetical protein